MPIKSFKVIVIGDPAVGKTSLTYRLCENKFLETTESTIGVDFRTMLLNIDGEEIKLQLWDTAGEERFRNTMVTHYYRNSHAIVLVYAVSRRGTFNNLVHWMKEGAQNCPQDIPKILIGNKCDEPREVSTQEAQKFADTHNMPLFETSAKSDQEYNNINSMFMTLALKLKNEKQFMSNKNTVTLGAAVEDKTNTSSCPC